MNRISLYKWFLIIILAAPYWVFADSLAFTPSTSVYGANTDPSVVSVVSGTHAWNCFDVAGNHLGGGGGQFGSGTGVWSTFLTGNNIDVDAGSAGTFSCLLNDYSSGSQTQCSGNSATVSSCLGSPSYVNLRVDYVLTTSGGGGGGSTGSSTPPNGGGALFSVLLGWWSIQMTEIALIGVPIILFIIMSRRIFNI